MHWEETATTIIGAIFIFRFVWLEDRVKELRERLTTLELRSKRGDG